MKGLRTAALVLLASVVSTGCTIRHSQTIAGRLERVNLAPIHNANGGVEVGIGFGTNILVATFSEPMSSHELLTIPCDSGIVQVDYRALAYAYYIAGSFPELKTTAYCVSKP
jgi:hypothetical protein